MTRSIHAVRGAAIAGVLALALAACSGDASEEPTVDTGDGETGSAEGSTDALTIGTLLPLTGTLAFLGPPEIAGAGLAIQEINEAGGVLGQDVELVEADSGDSTDLNVSTQSATDLISQDVSAVVGAASSSVSLNVVDQITEAGVLQISPANTSATLSGYSDLYFRTAPPDTVQGSALGNVILEDFGTPNVAFLTQNEDYGTGLRDVVRETVEAGGGTVVYDEEFPPGESNFESYVTQLLASGPDAIVIIAFEESVAITNALVAAGWDMANTYWCDGNTADYSEDFEPGTLEGAKGTIPGAQASEEFRQALVDYYQEAEGEELTDFSYGPETYDAVMLVALAAVRGEGTDGQTIADNMAAVSGAEGGEECSTFADCLALLEDGEEIMYAGQSGIGPFNENNDPSSAFIGVYQYGPENTPAFQRAVEGQA